jgi:class 3 adenylate cyclase
VEGSTRRWEADAEGMRAALEAHDQVLRDAVAAHEGRVFKHTGDGVCAVFTSPKAAVDVAVTVNAYANQTATRSFRAVTVVSKGRDSAVYSALGWDAQGLRRTSA